MSTSCARRRFMPLGILLLSVLLIGALAFGNGRASAASETHALRLLTEVGPPFNFPGESGPEGFTVDIVRELLVRTGTTGAITFLPWARAYDMALREPNTVIFTISRNAEREERFQWVGPIMTLSWALFARAEEQLKVRSLEDARLLSGISTYRADVRENYLRGLGFANLHSAGSFESSVRMMLQGHVAAVVADGIGLLHYMKTQGLPADSVEQVFTFTTIGLYIAFSRNTDPALVLTWQKALEALRRDGTYARIHSRWLPPETLPDFDALPAMR